MARQAYVEIEYMPESVKFSYASSQNNNVSKVNRLDVFSRDKGFKGLYLNDGGIDPSTRKDYGTRLNGIYRLFPDDGYPGWNGNLLSGMSDTGNGFSFSTPQAITMTLIEDVGILQYVSVFFDSAAGEYATEYHMSFDSPLVTRRNSGYVMIIQIPDGVTTFTINFTKWNKANSVAKVVAIKAGYTGLYPADFLSRVDLEDEDRPSAEQIIFGMSNLTGIIQVFNIDEEFEILAEAGLLRDKLRTQIYADFLGQASQQVQRKLVSTQETGVFTVDENQPVVKISTTDKIGRLKAIQIGGIPLQSMTGLGIFEWIFQRLGWVEGVDYIYEDVYENDMRDDIDSAFIADDTQGRRLIRSTKESLKNYTFPNAYSIFGKAADTLEKIAIATLCRVYTRYDGMVCVKRII